MEDDMDEAYFRRNRREETVWIWKTSFAALRGTPDVLRSERWPEVIQLVLRRAREAMLAASRRRADEHERQVVYVISNLHLMYKEAPRAPRGLPTNEKQEHKARSHRRFLEQQQAIREALTAVAAAKKQNDKEIEAIAEHFCQVIVKQVAAVKRHHPHREHLDAIPVPDVTIPEEARDIGLTSIINAVKAYNRPGELDWVLSELSAKGYPSGALDDDDDTEDGSAA
jgi:hypothetical protein